jgi:hypothetical protein
MFVVKGALDTWQSQNYGHFNLLHLRAENDWLKHCAIWSAIADGVDRSNCLGDVHRIGSVLDSFNFNQKIPLIVVSNLNDTNPTFGNALKSLSDSGYKVYNNN